MVPAGVNEARAAAPLQEVAPQAEGYTGRRVRITPRRCVNALPIAPGQTAHVDVIHPGVPVAEVLQVVGIRSVEAYHLRAARDIIGTEARVRKIKRRRSRQIHRLLPHQQVRHR